jgi:hypothetical protein
LRMSLRGGGRRLLLFPPTFHPRSCSACGCVSGFVSALRVQPRQYPRKTWLHTSPRPIAQLMALQEAVQIGDSGLVWR